MINNKDLKRESFTFYASWEQGISKIKDPEARESVYRAIVRYSLFGEEPELSDPMAIMCWEFAKPIIDKARTNSFVSRVRKPSLNGNNNASKNASKNERKTNEKRTKNERKTKKIKDKIKDKDNNIFLLADESAKTNTEEDKFIGELKEQYPRVMSMNEPLTYEQCTKLVNNNSKDQIRDILSRMENYENLHKNCHSAYLTALNWLKRENNKAK